MVISGTCPKTGCSVAESGICLLRHDPIDACPNFKTSTPPNPLTEGKSDIPSVISNDTAKSEIPILTKPERRFHTGLELGIDDALEISRKRYCHVLGILGATDAGKTCCLLSLYLAASHGKLPNGYRFAGSLTLKGFEDRARRLREWKSGPLPSQLADHTILSDTRQAGLLHLALRQGPKGRRIDLLLTDLPGEWSKTLVDRSATADRFSFLLRADGIVIVVDGKVLESEERNVEILRTKHLLERLKQNVGVNVSTPMTLLISKGDAIRMNRPAAADQIVQHAGTLGFNLEVTVAAAFSYDNSIPSGTGVFEAIERLVTVSTRSADRTIPVNESHARRFAAFGRSNS